MPRNALDEIHAPVKLFIDSLHQGKTVAEAEDSIAEAARATHNHYVCDLCKKDIQDNRYHCKTCTGASFDLCSGCWNSPWQSSAKHQANHVFECIGKSGEVQQVNAQAPQGICIIL